MANVTARVFPLESVAEQKTTVRPIRKRLPERGLHLTATCASTSSRAETAYTTRTLRAPRAARTIFADGAVMVGGVRPRGLSVPHHRTPHPPFGHLLPQGEKAMGPLFLTVSKRILSGYSSGLSFSP